MRKVALQRIAQLQSWLEHSSSSQADVDALAADAILKGNNPWDIGSEGSFRELLCFQHHKAAGELARCPRAAAFCSSCKQPTHGASSGNRSRLGCSRVACLLITVQTSHS